jgi:hypothetical protein
MILFSIPQNTLNIPQATTDNPQKLGNDDVYHLFAICSKEMATLAVSAKQHEKVMS